MTSIYATFTGEVSNIRRMEKKAVIEAVLPGSEHEAPMVVEAEVFGKAAENVGLEAGDHIIVSGPLYHAEGSQGIEKAVISTQNIIALGSEVRPTLMVSANLSLGKDAEIKTSNNGNSYIFGSAAHNAWDGSQKVTNWVNYIGFSNISSRMDRFARKGAKIVLMGRMVYEKWGDDSVHAKIVINDFDPVGNGGGSNGGGSSNTIQEREVSLDLG